MKKNLPENELLSAYLDGELTAEQQAEAERLLAENPSARQLLDQLRALSSTLQAMPQYKLGDDISDAVLRSAEREILTRPVAPASEPSSRRLPDWRRFINLRSLTWSAAAVAAAVLLMVLNPQDRERLDVAKGPEPGGINEPTDGEPAEDRLVGNLDSRKTPAGTENDLDSKSDEARRRIHDARSKSPSAGRRGFTADKKSHGTTLRGVEAASDANMKSRTASKEGNAHITDQLAARPTATADMPGAAKQHHDMSFARKPAPLDVPIDSLGRPKGVSGPRGKAAGPPARSRAASGRDDYGGRQQTRSLAAQGGGSPHAGKAGTINGPPATEPVQRYSGLASSDAAPEESPPINAGDRLFAGVRQEQISNGHATVFCDISPKVLQTQGFTRLLGKNEIAVGEVALKRNVQWDKEVGSQAIQIELQKKLDNSKPGPADLKVTLGSGSQRETVPLDEAAVAQLGADGKVDVYYVEATASQIKATLEDLGRQPDEFLAVTLQPDDLLRQKKGQTGYGHGLARGRSAEDRPNDVSETAGERHRANIAAAGDIAGTALAQQRVATEESDAGLAENMKRKDGETTLGDFQGGGQSQSVASKTSPPATQSIERLREQADGQWQDFEPQAPPAANVPGQTAIPDAPEPEALAPKALAPKEPAPEAPLPDAPAPEASTVEGIAQQQGEAAVRNLAASNAVAPNIGVPNEAEPHFQNGSGRPGEKAESEAMPQQDSFGQPAVAQEQTPGQGIAGGLGSPDGARPGNAINAGDPDRDGAKPDSRSQTLEEFKSVADDSVADTSVAEEPTYRVFFVLRVVGGESGNAAASIMAKDADVNVQTGPELTPPSPTDPPTAEQPAVRASQQQQQ